MKRFVALGSFLIPLAVVGCGQPLVIAEAALSEPGTGERIALGTLPVRLLPYDRDAIFDSLTQASSDPEPPIPPEIIEQQRQVQEAQTAWQAAQERWNAAREEQRVLSEQLRQMEGQGLRSSPQYIQGFQRFNALSQAEQQAKAQMDAAFARFDQLQQQTLTAAESIKVQRDMWADQAFADFNRIVALKLRESGREEVADTTDAQGFARFRVPEGRWWVYARYTLPYEELYWNVPVEVSSDSVHVPLTRENAESRPVL